MVAWQVFNTGYTSGAIYFCADFSHLLWIQSVTLFVGLLRATAHVLIDNFEVRLLLFSRGQVFSC